MIDNIKNIQIPDAEMNRIMGDLAEKIAINEIVKNHRQIIQMIYPDTEEKSAIQILNTYATEFRVKPIGHIGMKNRKKTIYGWYGDLVMIIHSKQHGKRAIIFEMKYGKGKLTNGQKEFFKEAINESPSDYMPKLNDLKIFIVHMSKFSFIEKSIDMEIVPFLNEKEWNDRAFRIGLDKLNEIHGDDG